MSLQLRLALRSLVKNKTYLLINVLGMGVALACCIVAYLNYQEWSDFDSIYADTGDVYRINATREVEAATQLWGVTPHALAPAAIEKIPGIERYFRMAYDGASIRHDGTMIGQGILFVDDAFLAMMPYEIKSGDPSALSDPGQIVLTERAAERYFGDEDPVGKSLDMLFVSQSEERTFNIGAVVYNQPENSSIWMDVLASFEVRKQLMGWDESDWSPWQQPVTFVELSEGVSVDVVESGLQEFVAPQNQARPNWAVSSFFLQPLADIGHGSFEFEETGLNNPPPFEAVMVLIVLAGLILLIACFNFTNTTIALSGSRLREIGLRKAVGAQRSELIRQFLIESLVLCVPALLAGLLFSWFLAIGLYEQGMSAEPTLTELGDVRTWTFLAGIVIATALLAGAYPALYISSFRPVQIFQGRSRFKGTNIFTRVLLGLQLTASITAIITGVVFFQNAKYQEELPLGFKPEGIVNVPVFNENVLEVFEPVALAAPGVKNVTSSGTQAGVFAYQALFSEDREGASEFEVYMMDAGPRYVETLQMEMASGRTFDEERATDYEAAIINEELMRTLGWTPQTALGQPVISDGRPFTVIGVVKDYKQFGMRQPVPPMSMHLVEPPRRLSLSILTEPDNREALQAHLEDKWYELFPDMPFYSGYLEEAVYGQDRQTNRVMAMSFLFLALIATALSAFGLFALISLRIAARTKELGVRKVLGASVGSLLALINREVVLIVVAATVVGSVLGYYACNAMLDDMFAFRMALGPSAAILAVATVIAVTAATVGYKVFSAATSNPVDSLRVE